MNKKHVFTRTINVLQEESMQLIIDRFEGDYAICEREDKTFINVPRKQLPKDANEGDVIIFENGKYMIDKETTKKRRDAIRKKMDELWD